MDSKMHKSSSKWRNKDSKELRNDINKKILIQKQMKKIFKEKYIINYII